MKKFTLITLSLTIATMAFASSCKKYDTGRAYILATRLAEDMHDTAKLHNTACDIEAWLDSMEESPADAIIAREILLQESAKGRSDSANLIMQTILYDALALGKKISKECCDQLMDSLADVRAITDRINIIRGTYVARGETSELWQFDKAFQNYVDSLPVEEQMRIYSCATTKLKLSIAIRNEAMGNPVKANEAIEALKNIYDEKEFSEFMQYYSTK